MNSYSIFGVDFGHINIPVVSYCYKFFVPLKLIIMDIGIDWGRQNKKVHKIYYNFDICDLNFYNIDGTTNNILCICLSDLDKYLQTIKLDHAPIHVQEKLEKYQKICAKFLLDCLNSKDLEGVVYISTPINPYFKNLVAHKQWNKSALQRLGICIGE